MKKRRVGLILPSVNIHMEPEFNGIAALSDIDFFATRVFLTDTTEETLVQMEQGLDSAAGLIETVYPEAVVYACTSGSFIKGLSWDDGIIAKIEQVCRCPAITASRAMVNALSFMGAASLTLVTPYTSDINEREKQFIESFGIKVTAMSGFEIVDAEELRTLSAERIIERIKAIDVDESEAVFISCTNVEGLRIAEALEKQLGKPVLCSNTATLWALLKLLKIDRPLEGYGELLRWPRL